MNKVIFLLSILVSTFACADLVKLSDEGIKLNIDDTEWSCVLDEDSSLIWEVKNDEEGIQYKMSTYTWFDGKTGTENGKYSRNCFWGKGCNTKAYVDAINKQQLCSFNDWRLPSRDELLVKFVGTINQPMSKLVGTLNGAMSKFSMVLSSLKDSKS